MRYIKSGNKRKIEIQSQLAIEESKMTKPTIYSKLKIYIACSKAGIWNKVEQWMAEREIDGINMLKAYQEAQQISNNHPLFMDCIGRIQEDLNLENKLIQQLLLDSIAD